MNKVSVLRWFDIYRHFLETYDLDVSLRSKYDSPVCFRYGDVQSALFSDYFNDIEHLWQVVGTDKEQFWKYDGEVFYMKVNHLTSLLRYMVEDGSLQETDYYIVDFI